MMDQHALVMTIWLGTGTLGLVFGMVAVSVAKRRALIAELGSKLIQPQTT